jgi:membrane protein involved in colicin uptake
MSKKVAIIISVVLFIILCALIVCEKKWPTAGTDLVLTGMLIR